MSCKSSECHLEATHCRETRHVVATVYHIAGIGDVVESYKYRYIPAYIPCDLEVQNRIVLIPDVVGDVEVTDTLEVSRHIEEFPWSPFHTDINRFLCANSKELNESFYLFLQTPEPQPQRERDIMDYPDNNLIKQHVLKFRAEQERKQKNGSD